MNHNGTGLDQAGWAFLLIYMFSFLLNKYLGVEFAGSYGRYMFNFTRSCEWFSEGFERFYISMSNVWDFWLFHIFANI